MDDPTELWIDEEKTAFNLRAKSSMREFLRSKSCEEKVRSIERMNAASRAAKEGMRKATADKARRSASVQSGDAEDVGG